MRNTLQSTWPLFFGLIMLMVGSGLQGTLIGVRATIEGFSTNTTGIIMSLYYAGYLAGTILGPKLVSNVGHIRVFAAMASLASTTSLIHGIFVDPAVWGFARVLTGFSFAVLFIVIESWMNDVSTKETRGKILASYMLTFYGGMMGGQYLLNLAAPERIELFVLISVLVSIALLPISLIRRPAPEFEAPQRLKITELIRITPLGTFTVTMSGMGSSIFFTIGPIFAMNNQMPISTLVYFMMIFNLGGALFQYPLGALSDRFGRRIVIGTIAGMTGIMGLLCYFAIGSQPLLFAAVLLYGGFSLSIYALAAAYTNDHLEKEYYVSASASLLLIGGAASIVGPLLATLIMSLFGNNAFFLLLACIYGLITPFAYYRSLRSDAVPLDEQVNYLSLSPRSTYVSTQIGEEAIEDSSS